MEMVPGWWKDAFIYCHSLNATMHKSVRLTVFRWLSGGLNMECVIWSKRRFFLIKSVLSVSIVEREATPVRLAAVSAADIVIKSQLPAFTGPR